MRYQDCSARQYIQYRPAATLAQTSILQRSHDYTLACKMWMDNICLKPYAQYMDHLRCNDLARMAATLAFLSFPDLRQPDELVIEPLDVVGMMDIVEGAA